MTFTISLFGAKSAYFRETLKNPSLDFSETPSEKRGFRFPSFSVAYGDRKRRHIPVLQETPINQSFLSLTAFLVALALISGGCSTSGSTVLKVDARGAQGVQSLRQEITWMLTDLGYDWVPVRHPETDKLVKAYRHAGQWKMLFQARSRPKIRIDARFDIAANEATLRFHEVGKEGFSAESEPYYRKLRERLVLEFGPDQVDGRDYLKISLHQAMPIRG